jgi:hypothetical protein
VTFASILCNNTVTYQQMTNCYQCNSLQPEGTADGQPSILVTHLSTVKAEKSAFLKNFNFGGSACVCLVEHKYIIVKGALLL